MTENKNIKYIVIIVLSLFWLYINANKIIYSLNTISKSNRFSEQVVENNYLKIAVFLDISEKKEEYLKFIRLALKNLGPYENNASYLIKNAILLCETGKIKEGKINIEKINKSNPVLSDVLYAIYIDKKPVKDQNLAFLLLNKNLKGFYLYNSLKNLYIINNEEAQLKMLIKKYYRISSVYVYLFTILIFVFLFFIIFGIINTYLLFRDRKKLFKDSNDKFTFSLTDCWLFFLIWDFIHVFSPYLIILFGLNIKSIYSVFFYYVFITLISLAVFVFFFKIKNISCFDFLKFRLNNLSGILKDSLKYYSVALLWVLIAAVINSKILKQINFSSNPIFEIINNANNPYQIVLLFLLVCIIGPFVEEIVFRGVLYNAFKMKCGVVFSIIISSMIFSFIHGDPAGFLPIFVLGVILAVSYQKTGNLFTSFLLHSLWNTGTFIVFYNVIS